MVGLDGRVGTERRDAVLGGVRADFRESRADGDALAQAVSLVFEDLRDPLDDPWYLLLAVEVDQLLQRPRVVPPALLQGGKVGVGAYPVPERPEEVHPLQVGRDVAPRERQVDHLASRAQV